MNRIEAALATMSERDRDKAKRIRKLYSFYSVGDCYGGDEEPLVAAVLTLAHVLRGETA